MRRALQLVLVLALAAPLAAAASAVQAAPASRGATGVAEVYHLDDETPDLGSSALFRFTETRLTIRTANHRCRYARSSKMCTSSAETVDQALPAGAAQFSRNGRVATLAETTAVVRRTERSCFTDSAGTEECTDRPVRTYKTSVSANFVGVGRAVRERPADGKGRPTRTFAVPAPQIDIFDHYDSTYFRTYYGLPEHARVVTTPGR